MRFALKCCVGFAVGVCTLPAAFAEPAQPQEITRVETWVSPLWGYNTPKIAWDGRAWHAAGMRGKDTKSGEALVFRNAGDGWKETAALPGAYQPPTVAVDGTGRLIVAHTRVEAPVRLLRARTAENTGAMDELSPPPGMKNAYYIGMAVRGAELWLSWIDAPGNSLFFAHLDLLQGAWSGPTLLMAGQTQHKRKTAWVYPILYPARDGGLHFAASNAPDGGEGNTYNEVWYLHFPKGTVEPDLRERVADTPMGTLAFCTDLAEDDQGRPHLAFMYNTHVYGDPLPANAGPAGLWHAWRDAATHAWTTARLGESGIAGFTTAGEALRVFLAGNGAVLRRTWRATEREWTDPETVVPIGKAPSGPGFFDTLSASSGGPRAPGPAFISDGTLKENDKNLCITWAVLPDGTNKQPTETSHEP